MANSGWRIATMAICHWLSAIGYPPSAIGYLQSAIFEEVSP
jgi:hypothetical protein